MSLRWQDYVLEYEDNVPGLWTSAFGIANRATFILGAGFDPRALVGVERFLATVRSNTVNVITLGLPGGQGGEPRKLADQNKERLATLKSSTAADFYEVTYPRVHDRLSAGQRITHGLMKSSQLPSDGLIVIDISGLPASIYFPLVGGILEQSKKGEFRGDLQLVVCENPEIDRRIFDEGSTDPGAIKGFSHGLTKATAASVTKVWAPVIGERQGAQLTTLFEFLAPDEICPVLPFPSSNPRRADDLIIEHRVLLFDRMEVEPRNFIYADETNPFDLYRALTRLAERYISVLAPLGEAVVVTSVHASKMLSVGALLAAWESSLPVATVANTGYMIESADEISAMSPHNRLACIWLEGEPYR